MDEIDKLEKIIDALHEHFPYDRRVDGFKTLLKQTKSRLDRLVSNVADFMKKEGIKGE
ncbi:MAG: hypothetical protein KGD61_10970 [Candidatus Lokiarchaeota archaeon]|nr:hypothetical protein [Candidatus Lokiarchaeota archaeon]